MSLPGEFDRGYLEYHREHLQADLHRGDLGVVRWVRQHAHRSRPGAGRNGVTAGH